jgi:hypothetical protein
MVISRVSGQIRLLHVEFYLAHYAQIQERHLFQVMKKETQPAIARED